MRSNNPRIAQHSLQLAIHDSQVWLAPTLG
jgi:hypothetical protein